MSVWERLAIGTANWNEQRPYGHRGVTCPRKEQEDIISYCMSAGIHAIDTATAYEVDLSWLPTAFTIATKIKWSDRVDTLDHRHLFVAHSAQDRKMFYQGHRPGVPTITGTSFYDPGEELDLYFQDIWNVPYSPFDRRWEEKMAEHHDADGEVWVRSIFVQGKVFTSAEPPFLWFRSWAENIGLPVGTLCLLFCLLNPNVDKVVLGVDSLAQLREDLRFFHRLGSFAVEDADLIDPRRWSS